MRKQASSAFVKPKYARYEPPYSQIPKELLSILVEKKVGRNGWPVMVVLSMAVLDDGSFGLATSKWIQDLTGLDERQVSRGMEELRNKEIICPVVVEKKSGVGRFDRSCYGHVARYQFTKQVWDRIAKEGGVP